MSKVRYHRNGTVTLSGQPKRIVAFWGKDSMGEFWIRSAASGPGKYGSTLRCLLDDVVRLWAQSAPKPHQTVSPNSLSH